MPWTVTGLWTLAALIAFAGNSVLCRAALSVGTEPALGLGPSVAGPTAPISPLGFTGVRLLAGAVALIPFLIRSPLTTLVRDLDRRSVAAMVGYAIAFSLSYVTLPAGPGALILFGTVQITMVAAAAVRKEPIGRLRLFGMAIAFAGLVRLVSGSDLGGSDQAIDPWGAALMTVAGIGWGIYTLRGRGAISPTRTTALNFAGSVPVAVALIAWSLAADDHPWQARGFWLAAASGAVTSGAGYAIWYHALHGHSRTSAAAVQLAVPIIAALGGAAYLGEPVTRRLVEATALTLGGIAVALFSGNGAPRALKRDKEAPPR